MLNLTFSNSIILYGLKTKGDVYIYNKYDIDAHLDVLCNNKIISETLSTDKRSSAHKLFLNKYLEILFYGGTYIPFKTAMYHQRYIKYHSITVNIDNVRVIFN